MVFVYVSTVCTALYCVVPKTSLELCDRRGDYTLHAHFHAIQVHRVKDQYPANLAAVKQSG